MSILPKAIYRFNAIPIRLPMVVLRELEQIISQFVWNYKKPWLPKAILRKKNGTGGIKPAWLQTTVQSYSHQDSMSLAQRQKYRSMEQNRKPEINPCTYGHLIFDKGGKNIQWRKDNLFNKWCWENWSTTCKRMKRTLSNTIHKNKLKMDQRFKYETRNHKTPRGKHRQNTLWHKSQQDPLWLTSQSNGNKSKNKQMGPN